MAVGCCTFKNVTVVFVITSVAFSIPEGLADFKRTCEEVMG